MQLTTPDFSAYGVSFPGSPNIIIGFNNYIAWAVTNAGRDVKDYYELKFKNEGMNEYWYNGEWVKPSKRPELIKIKERDAFIDTVSYTASVQ
jgi:penicillin amidase